ncbi:VanW family protein [Duncaniella sp.]|uniref:VanW family protein n=1 Tax=Duncaniella sp. TaxID=2518496 RepID=UPI0023C1780C|nr:VanW family protein [Duncaniella sp.]MDE5904903.1 VanW family protein [Duncaniella sp.]
MGKRKLFCEISPLTYRISVKKNIFLRKIKDALSKQRFARRKSNDKLPVMIYKHASLIRRKLGNTNLELQENKAVNLALSAPKVNGILIRPGETFSFWHLVGPDTAQHGYKVGLTISNNKPSTGVGGGHCQFTNLIHWMVLHSDLTIVEHHHHDGFDLFPDYKRQIPFGTGTSIVYNYLDYRFRNDTDNVYQMLVYTDGEYLRGELRASKEQESAYHICAENEFFSEENGIIFRNGTVIRKTIDKKSGICINQKIIRTNHARVMYDPSGLEIRKAAPSLNPGIRQCGLSVRQARSISQE